MEKQREDLDELLSRLHVEISEAVRATKIILFIERCIIVCIYDACKALTP